MKQRDINTMSDAELVLEMLGMLGDPGNRNPFAPVPISELAEQVAEFNEIQLDDDEPGRPIGELGAVLGQLAGQGLVQLNIPAGTVALKAPPL